MGPGVRTGAIVLNAAPSAWVVDLKSYGMVGQFARIDGTASGSDPHGNDGSDLAGKRKTIAKVPAMDALVLRKL